MNRIAKFEKVSIGQFTAAWKDTFQEQSEEKICEIYGALKLPQRATAGSAGYDFFAPVDLVLAPGETIKIPTGVRVWMVYSFLRFTHEQKSPKNYCRTLS